MAGRSLSCPAVWPGPVCPACAAGLVLGSVPGLVLGQGGQQRGRAGERHGVEPERKRCRRGEQQAAGRRPEERLADGQADLLAAVGLGQELGRDQRGQHRLGGVAGDHLGAAQAEAGHGEHPDAGLAGDDEDGEHRHHAGLDGLGRSHERGAVAAVDDGAGRQREQQPGQVGRCGHHRHQPRVPGDGHRQQRQRGGEGAVTGGTDRVGPPQSPVIPPQARRLALGALGPSGALSPSGAPCPSGALSPSCRPAWLDPCAAGHVLALC